MIGSIATHKNVFPRKCKCKSQPLDAQSSNTHKLQVMSSFSACGAPDHPRCVGEGRGLARAEVHGADLLRQPCVVLVCGHNPTAWRVASAGPAIPFADGVQIRVQMRRLAPASASRRLIPLQVSHVWRLAVRRHTAAALETPQTRAATQRSLRTGRDGETLVPTVGMCAMLWTHACAPDPGPFVCKKPQALSCALAERRLATVHLCCPGFRAAARALDSRCRRRAASSS